MGGFSRMEQGHNGKETGTATKKGGPGEGPPFPCRSFRARDVGNPPPLPRDDQTLFDAACVTASPATWSKTGEQWSVRETISLALSAKPIVNLTLTQQRRRQRSANAASAWTLQDPSCTTVKGMCVRESGTYLSH